MVDKQFVCFITNKNYLNGLALLSYTLLKNTSIPLSVVIPDNSDDDFYQLVKKFSYNSNIIKMPLIDVDKKYFENKYEDYWKETFFKLNAAKLVQFKKIVLLDIDLVIQKNIDELFNFESFSASNSGYVFNHTSTMFNSGVLVLEPSSKLFNDLVNLIPTVLNSSNGRACGDQDVFNAYFPDWFNHKNLVLSEKYNCFYGFSSCLSKTLKHGFKDISVLHYWGKEKIWELPKKRIIKLQLGDLLRLNFRTAYCRKLAIKYFKRAKRLINKNEN